MAESPQPVAHGLHIVLFGMPAAGKSSLLGALVQAAEAQPQVLGGRLEDVPEGLEELRKRVVDGKPRPTASEVVPYPLTFQGSAGPTPLTLFDCDGRVASEYLVGKKNLEGAGAEGALAQAVDKADTLILAVDASTPGPQLEKDFAQFGAFMRLVEEHRGRLNEAAGLPVYLVLTKCDLLAKQDDTTSKWMQRIEEAKRKIDQKFREFLARTEQQGTGLFGAIDLHLWATAVKRPSLGERSAKASEPFGVAELFRQVIESGQQFQQHRVQTGRTLVFAAVGVAFFVGLLGVLAGFFYLNRPSSEVTALENAVRRALPGNTAADRLREPLEDRLKQLAQIKANAAFDKLLPRTQQDVRQAQEEIEAYQALSKAFKSQVQDPRFITREEELVKNERLLEQFALPAQYAEPWSETNLAQRRLQWQSDLKKLRQVVDAETAWIREQIKEGEQLRKKGGLVIAQAVTPKEREEWFAQVKGFLDREVRHKRTDRLAGSPTLTYDTVYRFDKIDQAHRDWDRTKLALAKIRDQAL